MSAKAPKWKLPKNLAKVVEDEGGSWEEDRWDPILLTVIGGTVLEGREIPLAWQIEFDPYDDRLEAARKELSAGGVEPDGYAWAERITAELTKNHPEVTAELHEDSEMSTCVVWVESEAACKALIETTWGLLRPAND
ncbi:MAG TPA: hypothetical protein VEA69_17445 [Tepidisphaeraceae bacterium]|nr:hypothetical protein [Tepidisphaeraceae bacterium]